MSPAMARMPHAREILSGAQPFGFGPVSKLVQIAGYFDRTNVSFIGEGGALRYAQLNDRRFAGIEAVDLADMCAVRAKLRHFDAVISVMEARLVFAAVRERKPVFFFDSLLNFWITDRELSQLAEIATIVRSGSEAAATAALQSLSVHETMLLSHLLATESYAQSLPGVAPRIAQLRECGCSSVHTTGPMIDLPAIERASRAAHSPGRSLVANLGGFTNAFLSYPQTGRYVDIIVRWLVRLAERSRDFDEIVICSGAFGDSEVRRIGAVDVRIGLLPHEELMRLVASSSVYLTAPGLTSLHEAVALSSVPMLLPAQHYGHVMNAAHLAEASFSAFATSFDALGLTPELCQDDLQGTLELAAIAARIDAEPELFDRFADYMNESLVRFMARTPEERAVQVRELRELLGGRPIGPLIQSLQQELAHAVP